MSTISTFLWFDDAAEEAVEFYTGLLPRSRILDRQVVPEGSPAPSTVVSLLFELGGQRFQAINAGPQFTFTEAISIVVTVTTQEELDRIWDALAAGGEESRCGWVRDRWGLWWQVVPTVLPELLGGGDSEAASRAMQAMLSMGRLDIRALEEAYAGP
ncbi:MULTISPECIES: VOC family protein [unclassified Rathayibacter]|uniref:VOC family protein n=1 Tax=unclassified Rathayibacter TaxID=2609250 RepID=UPI00188A9BAE|nr:MULTISPECIES: VOC family protein [unclassified Rathayibacter]MBF4461814.1 VOC family protein [Rathayibacter sp. VKM Ac-2879]MBF4503227.1 VOC family protein [Rathayibacter sp. VKM Ac-2878]